MAYVLVTAGVLKVGAVRVLIIAEEPNDVVRSVAPRIIHIESQIFREVPFESHLQRVIIGTRIISYQENIAKGGREGTAFTRATIDIERGDDPVGQNVRNVVADVPNLQCPDPQILLNIERPMLGFAGLQVAVDRERVWNPASEDRRIDGETETPRTAEEKPCDHVDRLRRECVRMRRTPACG